MIVDITYFTGDLHVAQKAQPAVAEKIGKFIVKYETEVLSLLLGDALYALFKAAIDPIVEPLDERWDKLLNGANFIDLHGVERKWVGFNDKDHSLIAGYIYFQYLRSEARIMSGSGAITPNTENAIRVDVIPLQVHAWNDMVKLNVLLFGFLNANAADYPEWKYAYDLFWYPSYNAFYHHNYNHYSFGYGLCSRRNEKLTDLFYTINSHNF